MKLLSHKVFIACEFIILCLLLPTYIWTNNAGNQMFVFLWAATLYTVIIWFHCHTQKSDRFYQAIKKTWRWQAVTWQNLQPIIVRWCVATLLIIAFTWQYETAKLFYIPKHRPEVIPLLATLYTLTSALPQEFIFCTFFMARYGKTIKNTFFIILLSALVFAYAHMLFLNWIAPVFSFFGGMIFAYTYLRSHSLALVTIEHGLYGNSIFLVGLGYYFYSGDTSAWLV